MAEYNHHQLSNVSSWSISSIGQVVLLLVHGETTGHRERERERHGRRHSGVVRRRANQRTSQLARRCFFSSQESSSLFYSPSLHTRPLNEPLDALHRRRFRSSDWCELETHKTVPKLTNGSIGARLHRHQLCSLSS